MANDKMIEKLNETEIDSFVNALQPQNKAINKPVQAKTVAVEELTDKEVKPHTGDLNTQGTAIALYPSKDLNRYVDEIDSNKNFTELYNELSNIDVGDYVKHKNGLSYLSWASAFNLVSKKYKFTFEIKWFDGKPYLFDSDLGYMVFTSITMRGETREMFLPVMDYKNRAMNNVEQSTGKGGTIAKATMFDINTTIMRCLVKNLAMFGFGMYIYTGEDVHTDSSECVTSEQIDKMKELEIKELNGCKVFKKNSFEELTAQEADYLIAKKQEWLDKHKGVNNGN